MNCRLRGRPPIHVHQEDPYKPPTKHQPIGPRPLLEYATIGIHLSYLPPSYTCLLRVSCSALHIFLRYSRTSVEKHTSGTLRSSVKARSRLGEFSFGPLIGCGLLCCCIAVLVTWVCKYPWICLSPHYTE